MLKFVYHKYTGLRQRLLKDRSFVKFLHFYRKGESVVWRCLCTSFDRLNEKTLEDFHVSLGIDAEAIFYLFELQNNVNSTGLNRLYFSLELPYSCKSFILQNDNLSCSTAMNPSLFKSFENAYQKKFGDAIAVDDEDRKPIVPAGFIKPLVSIVIPNKDNANLLRDCVTSLFERSTFGNIEVIIVENNSESDSIFDTYSELQNKYSDLKVVKFEGDFNYSTIINYGVGCSNGDFLLLLNNDTKVISADFLEQMIWLCVERNAGVVGAKLFFRDGLIQHAGIKIMDDGSLKHVNQNLSDDMQGDDGTAIRITEFKAVTGACQLIPKSVFNEVGGYSPEFAVGFNDADFCLKVIDAGYAVLFDPFAKLYHYEFTTRGRELADNDKLARWNRELNLFYDKWHSKW